ncbi:hypothetical protein ABZV34_34960 [Streptomyces sp. NPDC005195]
MRGSDHPFDMARPEPVRSLPDHGLDAGPLEANGRALLGIRGHG